MCGISGLVLRRDDETLRSRFRSLSQTHLARRGPDAFVSKLFRPAADTVAELHHARLSIIDLSGGAQPMTSADGRLTISFIVEIFNHVELRAELKPLERMRRPSALSAQPGGGTQHVASDG